MQNIDIYFLVIKDSFLTHFLFSIYRLEFAYPLVLHFGKYNNILATIAAIIGSTGGLLATFLLFYIFAKICQKYLENNHSYQPFKHYVNHYSALTMFFAALPQVSVLAAFIGGIARVNIFKFILIIIFYRLAYYIYLLNFASSYF